jgi:hypothetical protein
MAVTGGYRKLHNKGLYNLYTSPNISVTVSSSVELMGEMRSGHRTVVGHHGRSYLRDLDVDGRIILTWILQKWNMKIWTGFNCLRRGSSARIL